MKKNDWLIIISTAAYSFLFYDQSAGLNFFLFNIMLIALLLLQNRAILFKPAWIAVAAGSLISAFFIFWFGTTLPVLANVCSLLMLSGLSFNPQSSLLISFVNAVCSVSVAVPLTIKKIFSSDPEQDESESIFRKLPLVIIPLFVTAIFFIIYRAANPVFEKYTNNIDTDFISFEWIVFTGLGLIFMISVFRHFAVKAIITIDYKATDALTVITEEDHIASEPLLSVSNELLTGVILFAMLNLLLLSVNSLDIYFMWIVKHMPEGVTVAEYLHDGTNTLILSICLAIAVILFVFRGYLNFFRGNRLLRFLAYGWIAQNALLVITTAHRNWWIIESSGLTRRRLGIYVYLTLCIIGLATTFIKVIQRNSNWFLFRKNAWAFYSVFIICCTINWDNFIVRYNCNHFKALEFEYIDRDYQADLSHTSLASLFEYYKGEKANPNPAHKMFTEQMLFTMYDRYYKLKKETMAQSWKSYCVSKSQNVKAIDDMIAKGELAAKYKL